MKLFNALLLGLPLSFLSAPLLAEEVDAEEEATIEVVGDVNAQPEALTDAIALPQEAAVQAQESAAFGLETANRAREKGEETGQEQAEAARENSRMQSGFGAEISVEAQASGGFEEGTAQGDTAAASGLDINR